MNNSLLSSYRRHAKYAFLGLVSLLTIVLGDSVVLAREPAWCSEFLLCDIVTKGTVSDVQIRVGSLHDTWPMEVPGSDTMMVRVAQVTLRVDQVIKGNWGEQTIQFIVYIDASSFGANYVRGEQMVVGLVWGEDILGGTYRLWADQARLVWEGNEWVQQFGGKTLPNLDELRRVLATVATRRVLAAEEVVVLGRLVAVSSQHKYDDVGNEYVLKLLEFTNVRSLPGAGSTPPSQITVSIVRSGNYWPAWRMVSSCPRRLKQGRDYVVAIRNTEDGYVVPYGRDGIFELENNELFSVSGSRVGVSIESVAIDRSNGR